MFRVKTDQRARPRLCLQTYHPHHQPHHQHNQHHHHKQHNNQNHRSRERSRPGVLQSYCVIASRCHVKWCVRRDSKCATKIACLPPDRNPQSRRRKVNSIGKHVEARLARSVSVARSHAEVCCLALGVGRSGRQAITSSGRTRIWQSLS